MADKTEQDDKKKKEVKGSSDGDKQKKNSKTKNNKKKAKDNKSSQQQQKQENETSISPQAAASSSSPPPPSPKSSKKKSSTKSTAASASGSSANGKERALALMPKKRVLLVVGGKPSIDWKRAFQGATLHEGLVQVEVEQASWDDIRLVSYSDSGVVLDILPSDRAAIEATPVSSSSSTTNPARPRTIQPDFLLIRGAAQGVYGQDYRNLLIGFMHSGLASVNSLESLYLCQEKPIVYGKLRKVQKRLGQSAFPLIEQAYYPNWRTMTFAASFPMVIKVGTAHAGFGKMKLNDHGEFADFQSVVALQGRYVTAEPFVEWDYDFRIQKIGDSYRAFRRYSSNWKGKGLNQHDEDVEMNERYQLWIDEASRALGMDICALDGVHSKKDDKEYIIELNDSAIGLNSRYEEEDLKKICELVLVKMTLNFPLPSDKAANGSKGKESDKEENSHEIAKEQIAQLQVLKDRAVAERELLAAELARLKEKSAKKKLGGLGKKRGSGRGSEKEK